jgi:hypothetical protein
MSLVAGPLLPAVLAAQVAGRFPPDSLVATKVIPRATPVLEVIGMMRDISFSLGVRCQYCHVGEEGKPLATFDFASDEKRTKKAARQMMGMVKAINGSLDTLPERPAQKVDVTCRTCHRGVSRPVPLSTILVEAGSTGGADSAVRAYAALRERYYGRDAYDFSEGTLNVTAYRLGRAGKFPESAAMFDLNERYFPGLSNTAVLRGNVALMQKDTATAASLFREAIRRDATNDEARGRLKDIGAAP